MNHKHAISLTAAAAAAALAIPAGAGAAVTVTQPSATEVVLTGDAAADNVTINASNGNLTHGLKTAGAAGFNSDSDWDPATDGDQLLPSDGTVTVTIDGGDGDDNLAIGATADVAKAIMDGGAGNDLLTGSARADDLSGGAGNDRIVGFRGADAAKGGDGNDTLVWNNGDGSDVNDGEAGNDATEVNGAATTGDVFTVSVDGQRFRFDRTNLVPFNISIGPSTERLEVNGLGGDDSITATTPAALQLILDGGAGKDAITGGDGHDLIRGAEDADTLSGGAGDDRVEGNRGNDVMNGGAGDDTLVWNNGDGSDVMNGDAGQDVIEDNLAPAANDVATLAPNGQRVKFERTSPGPFTLDVASSEVFALNALGGDDQLSVADGTPMAVIANGGTGNDALRGSNGNETFLGGSGNDTLTGGAGLDLLDGQDGDDRLEARDGIADLVRGGAGTDSAVADRAGVDALDSIENADVEPTPVVAPARISAPKSVKIDRRGIARVKVSCPAAAAQDCSGTLRLLARIKAGRAKVTVQLASRKVVLKAGQSRTISLKVSRALAKAAKSKATVAVS